MVIQYFYGGFYISQSTSRGSTCIDVLVSQHGDPLRRTSNAAYFTSHDETTLLTRIKPCQKLEIVS